MALLREILLRNLSDQQGVDRLGEDLGIERSWKGDGWLLPRVGRWSEGDLEKGGPFQPDDEADGKGAVFLQVSVIR